MRLLENPGQLPYFPRACVVTNRTDGDFVDFQTIVDRPEATRLYMKTDIVEEAAKLLGMVPAKEVEELQERLAALGEEIQDVRETSTLAGELEHKLEQKEPVPCP